MNRVSFFSLMLLSQVSNCFAQQISTVVDANGKVVGAYAGPSFSGNLAAGTFAVQTARGYRVWFFNEPNQFVVGSQGESFDGYRYVSVYFSQDSCVGDSVSQVVANTTPPPQGWKSGASIFRENLPGGQTEFWAVPGNVVAADVQVRSRRSQGACESITPQVIRAVPVTPNVPSSTGFPNPPVTGPFRIEPEPLSQFFELFKNGFESALLLPHVASNGVPRDESLIARFFT